MRTRTGGRDWHGHLRASPLIITPASSRIGGARERHSRVEERLGLAEEQPARRKARESRHRAEIAGRPYNGTYRKLLPVEEGTGLGHDQISLEVLAERIKVWKRQSIGRIGQLNRVASLVLPGLEVHGFGRADTEKDKQDLWVGYLLGQRRIEAAAALLN